jgi:hypothetical protein
MQALSRFVRRAVFGALGLTVVACASSTAPSQGVTNPQPANRCFGRDAACVADNDCCSLWCVNGQCERKQP